MGKIQLIQSDITTLQVDAIVNAANSSLLGGGGVDGAIHRKGGPGILKECRAIRARQGGCETGEAVITSGGNLPARFVIHTVGPVWNDGNHNEHFLLAKAYKSSLALAVDHQIQSIAFPNISTGIYGFPKKLAASIAIEEVKIFIQSDSSVNQIIFVCFDDENYTIYNHILSGSQ